MRITEASTRAQTDGPGQLLARSAMLNFADENFVETVTRFEALVDWLCKEKGLYAEPEVVAASSYLETVSNIKLELPET